MRIRAIIEKRAGKEYKDVARALNDNQLPYEDVYDFSHSIGEPTEEDYDDEDNIYSRYEDMEDANLQSSFDSNPRLKELYDAHRARTGLNGKIVLPMAGIGGLVGAGIGGTVGITSPMYDMIDGINNSKSGLGKALSVAHLLKLPITATLGLYGGGLLGVTGGLAAGAGLEGARNLITNPDKKHYEGYTTEEANALNRLLQEARIKTNTDFNAAYGIKEKEASMDLFEMILKEAGVLDDVVEKLAGDADPLVQAGGAVRGGILGGVGGGMAGAYGGSALGLLLAAAELKRKGGDMSAAEQILTPFRRGMQGQTAGAAVGAVAGTVGGGVAGRNVANALFPRDEYEQHHDHYHKEASDQENRKASLPVQTAGAVAGAGLGGYGGLYAGSTAGALALMTLAELAAYRRKASDFERGIDTLGGALGGIVYGGAAGGTAGAIGGGILGKNIADKAFGQTPSEKMAEDIFETLLKEAGVYEDVLTKLAAR